MKAEAASGVSQSKRIESFSGEHRFLSNFYKLPQPIEWEGLFYPSTEHAFQAAKTLDPIQRSRIQAASTPGEAKRLGRSVTLRHGWDDMRVFVMDSLLWLKFSHPILRRWLLETGDAELVEGNTWGDTFWGVCKGRGQNHLGKGLMRIRDAIRREGG